MLLVVDTNVAVVANGNSQQASPECVIECLHRLGRIVRDEDSLALDDQWRIIREYRANLSSTGQPGPGDAFLKWVLTNWANPNRCVMVAITPVGNDENSFAEFPEAPGLADFDPADRKFVALNGSSAEATDTSSC
ncbi:MAG: hypothetical protein L0Y75_03515 [Acidobacteria bacterium]|nr:hypothetical protein [Acidobacteriota bacterium]